MGIDFNERPADWLNRRQRVPHGAKLRSQTIAQRTGSNRAWRMRRTPAGAVFRTYRVVGRPAALNRAYCKGHVDSDNIDLLTGELCSSCEQRPGIWRMTRAATEKVRVGRMGRYKPPPLASKCYEGHTAWIGRRPGGVDTQDALGRGNAGVMR